MSIRFGVDLDGVCADFQRGWAEAYEHWWPGRLDWSKLDTWSALFTETHFGTEDDFWQWTDDADVWRNLRVVDGAQGALYDLSGKGVEIIFITARHERAREATYDWTVKHFSFANGLYLAKDKATVPCDVYVDDSPVVLKHLINSGKNVIRFDQPWNQGAAGPGARNWKEVQALVEVLL